MTEHEFAELSAGYALDALSPEDARAFLDALAEHPEWQSIVDADAAAATLLAETAAEVAPPPQLRGALLAQIAGPRPEQAAAVEFTAVEFTATPAPTPAVPKGGRRWGRWAFALAASLVLLGGAAFGALSLSNMLNRSDAVIALEQIENAPDAQSSSVNLADGGVATAHWSPSVGSVVLVTDGLPALSADQSFELWFVRGDEPISAGVFETDSGGDSTALLAGTMHEGDVIAVTIEPAGGSPDGLPSSDPIVVIATA